MPESPRWLAHKGRNEEAKATFATIARRNKRPVPNLDDCFDDCIALDEDEECRKGGERKKYTYMDLFSSWNMAVKTIIVLITW